MPVHTGGMDDLETDVLVVGAGPTGLMLANWLAAKGARVEIIDGKGGPTDQSRAIALQARSLEIYDQLGVIDEVLAESQAVRAIAPGYGRRRFGVLPIGELGAGITPYARLTMLEQSRNERLLVDNLRRRGVEVRWNAPLESMTDVGTAVTATIGGPAPTSIRARFLVGADGGNSLVRRSLGVEFEGSTTPQSFFVCDAVGVNGFSHDTVNIRFGDADFLIGFPMIGRDHHRIIGSAPERDGEVDESALGRHLADAYGLTWTDSTWFATYRVHHRVASAFRVGRVFLAGDAAHVHSPVGGQGMNTGLQDAHDLALKLVDVLRGRASEASLDRYEAERRPVAQRLVATADRAFQGVISRRWRDRTIRRVVVPVVMPVLLRLFPVIGVVPRLFGYVSQTRIHYWLSPNAKEAAHGRRGRIVGRRLRWTGDNFEVLRDAEWQVHTYGEARPRDAERIGRDLGAKTHAFAAHAPFRSGRFYLVRPDGFVAAEATPRGAVAVFRAALPDRWFTRTGV